MATQSQFETAFADALDVPKREAVRILDVLGETAHSLLKKKEPVTIRGLVRFNIIDRKARMGRNPATGEAIRIKASKKLRATPNKGLRDRLKVK